ncbi:MAG: tetratricopeptide repeat protein [Bacteroidales bacterium]|nr:tetratricopeptide repeat protein [Bacteroidales bacterium]
MTKKILFIISLIFIFIDLYGQNAQKDSLINLLDNIDVFAAPEESLDIINSIYEYTYQTDPQTALEKSGEAIKICDSILKDSAQIMLWYQRLAVSYLSFKQYDQAMTYLSEVKNYYLQKADSVNYAYTLYYIGDIYLGLNVLQLAFPEFEKASKIFQNNNVTEGIILVNIRLASFYFYENYDTEQTFEILNNSLIIAKGNDVLTSSVYKAIGEVYSEDLEIDSAIYYFTKSAQINEKISNQYELANCYLEIGKVYLENSDFQQSEEFLSKAKTIYKNLSIENKIAEVLNAFGELYFQQGDLTNAEQSFLASIQISLLNMFESENKLYSYKRLSEVYVEQNNFEDANFYSNKYIEELELSFQRKAQQGFTEIILNFQNAEKEKTIQLIEKDNALKTQMLKNKQQQTYGFLAVIILLIGFAVVLYFYFQKQKKINKLLQEQNRQINLQKKEIESQSRILEKATRDLLKQKDEVQKKSNKITSSINYASRIQKAMLSPEELFKKHFRDYFILFMPKETVSGDFYWITEVKDLKPSLFKENDEPFKVIFSVIDCTGHGVPGAFMSLLGDAYLNQIVNVQHIYEPDKILAELHKIIRETLQQEHTDNNDGMDMAICSIDKRKKIMEFSGAKNPIVYIQNGKMNRISGGMMSVGGLQKEHERYFTKHTIDLTAKTQVFLFSDGYQDQFGGKYGRKFMAQPFRDLIFESSNLPATEQKEIIIDTLNKWKGKKFNQMDDITVLRIDV